jgi:hypothetical protein
MSYSRWSNSEFYTYSDVNKIDNEPTLTCWTKNGKGDFSRPISDLLEIDSILEIMNVDKDYSKEDLQQLREIIQDFIADHYKFFRTKK